MSNPLSWTDRFAVGHEAIDRQHREILDAINDVEEAIRGGADPDRLAPLVQKLRLAAEEHFRDENSVLWQIKTGTFKRRSSKALPRVTGLMADAAFDQHTAEHAFSLAALDEIARAPLAAMVDALKSWFVDHAIKHDSHLKAIFQAMS
ncbi:MAG TPA: hemerythrin domain-containing protein [Stellaceae bacterium]|nr:hemerythrin domain-containing protein [Stellaceae bacterium]